MPSWTPPPYPATRLPRSMLLCRRLAWAALRALRPWALQSPSIRGSQPEVLRLGGLVKTLSHDILLEMLCFRKTVQVPKGACGKERPTNEACISVITSQTPWIE